mgnify:FL=1
MHYISTSISALSLNSIVSLSSKTVNFSISRLTNRSSYSASWHDCVFNQCILPQFTQAVYLISHFVIVLYRLLVNLDFNSRLKFHNEIVIINRYLFQESPYIIFFIFSQLARQIVKETHHLMSSSWSNTVSTRPIMWMPSALRKSRNSSNPSTLCGVLRIRWSKMTINLMDWSIMFLPKMWINP